MQVGGLSYTGPGGMRLVGSFDEIGGLSVRAPVTIAGVKVGRVDSIELDEDLRARVAKLAGARGVLVGRIPSDAILPRAFHEMILVAPLATIDALREPLRETTVALSRVLGDAGAFEAP